MTADPIVLPLDSEVACFTRRLQERHQSYLSQIFSRPLCTEYGEKVIGTESDWRQAGRW